MSAASRAFSAGDSAASSALTAAALAAALIETVALGVGVVGCGCRFAAVADLELVVVACAVTLGIDLETVCLIVTSPVAFQDGSRLRAVRPVSRAQRLRKQT